MFLSPESHGSVSAASLHSGDMSGLGAGRDAASFEERRSQLLQKAREERYAWLDKDAQEQPRRISRDDVMSLAAARRDLSRAKSLKNTRTDSNDINLSFISEASPIPMSPPLVSYPPPRQQPVNLSLAQYLPALPSAPAVIACLDKLTSIPGAGPAAADALGLRPSVEAQFQARLQALARRALLGHDANAATNRKARTDPCSSMDMLDMPPPANGALTSHDSEAVTAASGSRSGSVHTDDVVLSEVTPPVSEITAVIAVGLQEGSDSNVLQTPLSPARVTTRQSTESSLGGQTGNEPGTAGTGSEVTSPGPPVFSPFLNKLKDPAAANIVDLIRSFTSSFSRTDVTVSPACVGSLEAQAV